MYLLVSKFQLLEFRLLLFSTTVRYHELFDSYCLILNCWYFAGKKTKNRQIVPRLPDLIHLVPSTQRLNWLNWRHWLSYKECFSYKDGCSTNDSLSQWQPHFQKPLIGYGSSLSSNKNQNSCLNRGFRVL